MSAQNVKKNSALAAAVVVITACVAITTCNTPFGLGDSIDFEPPVLTIEPNPPNPMFVRNGAVLAGKVTDNISVDRVIMRDAVTGEEMLKATLSGDSSDSKDWEIVMEFPEEMNNEKIAVEIVAFDRGGNTGETAIRPVTLIVDTGPPIVQDIWIQRTDVRRAELEPFSALKNLEITDRLGERSQNANRYQNGMFHISGIIAEDETRIEIVSLNIYDANRDPNTPLLELPLDKNLNAFSPRWLISEEDLINAGEARWTGYKDTYYSPSANNPNEGRYYYRVAIAAYDSSRNEGQSLITENEGFFVMWENADTPKGIVDPLVAGTQSEIVVTKGATLPVEFFDDDQLEWAYTGLLTIEQWLGTQSIAPGVSIPSAYTDAEKLQWLRNRFRGGGGVTQGSVYNWVFGRPGGTAIAANEITDSTNGNKIDETMTVVQTGNNDNDNGEFRLFSLAADTKLLPHPDPAVKDRDTYRTRERFRLWKVDVIDENEPLIVFDTVNTSEAGYNSGPNPSINIHPGGTINEPTATARTGDSPEENTFPRLKSGNDLGLTAPNNTNNNQYFELNGYILRANKKGVTNNQVIKFRMAWIPVALDNAVTISAVQNALKDGTYPDSMDGLEGQGVQHWNFYPDAFPPSPFVPPVNPDPSTSVPLITGTAQALGKQLSEVPNGEDIFSKQVFRKRFDILGGVDDKKPSYRNFTVNGARENDIKLFILYAEDNMGHVVFRQMRLLGNKTPPSITVYDLTDRSIDIKYGLQTPATNPGLPDLNNDVESDGDNYYFFNAQGNIGNDRPVGTNYPNDGRARYESTRLAYQSTAFTELKNIAFQGSNFLLDSSTIAAANAAYPRDTVIKYWVAAQGNGDLAVQEVKMRDVTFASNLDNVGYYDGSLSLSYIERLSEVTQRVFLFEATDSLGNAARIQRTVAVTNAAVLNSITTSTQTGSYGIGERITFQANFSNLVRWTRTGNADTDANRPKLNVRFIRDGQPIVYSIPTSTQSGTPTLSLAFPFTILEDDTGVIETMYLNMGTSNGNSVQGTDSERTNRPITLPTGTRLLDSTRGDDAFTPRNQPGFDWTTSRGSLQGGTGTAPGKTITLQGIRPIRNNFQLTSVPAGKQYWTQGVQGFFYRADETIEFTLTANRPIFTGSVDPVIQFQVNGQWQNAAWTRSGSTGVTAETTGNQMVFSALASTTNRDGTVTAIRLNNASSIVDSVGNAFVSGTGVINISTNGSVPTTASSTPSNVTIIIDKEVPDAPTVTLPGGHLINGNNPPSRIGSNPTEIIYYSSGPIMTIAAQPANETASVARVEFSRDDGASWEIYTDPVALSNGNYTIAARYTDRAGNIGTAENLGTQQNPRITITRQAVNVNARFPALVFIQGPNNSSYRAGINFNASGSGAFTLSFDGNVWTSDASNVAIILTNRAAAPQTHKASGTTETVNGVSYRSFERRLTANAIARPATATAGTTTVTFEWNNITGKEMIDGLYISAVDFTGLSDFFGNTGGIGTTSAVDSVITITRPGYTPPAGAVNPDTAPYTVANLNGAGIRVDCLAPVRSSTTPANGRTLNVDAMTPAVMTMAANNAGTIVLEFDEPVQRNSGTITVKPHGQFLIPPVFRNDGYYLNEATGEESANYAAGSTRVDGFFDIYNSGLLNTTDRGYLAAGSNMSNGLTLDARTGQSAGPYVRMTQGLRQGAGYTGNYSNTNPGADGPNPTGTAYMVPDTSTKWVLDYRYSIDNANNTQIVPTTGTANDRNPELENASATAVTNIRNTLTKAKFRWQEIDVTASNVVLSSDNKTVTITLNEPLLRGLKWDLCYPAGTFTDMAGNNAAAVNYSGNPAVIAGQGANDSTFMFWSYGVRAPVIRVNRKSFDARTLGWQGTGREYNVPSNRNAPGGWGIGDFNTVHYRIETETPDARIDRGTVNGRDSTVDTVIIGSMSVLTNNSNNAGVNDTWTAAVSGGGTVTGTTAANWNDNHTSASAMNGTWVRPNLVRRAGNGNGGYTIQENGQNVIRYFRNRPRMFRSYNKDALKSELDAVTLNQAQQITGSVSSGTALNFTYNATEASKNYVVAQARVNHNGTGWGQGTAGYVSEKSYEGVFRSVVALWQDTNDGTNTNQAGIIVEGSNVKNGMPTIAGFPVRDAEETGDNRFIKMFYRGTTTNRQFYWVSTEIVSEWYFIKWGGQGSHMQDGDVNNYLSAGYGDLTFGFSVRGF